MGWFEKRLKKIGLFARPLIIKYGLLEDSYMCPLKITIGQVSSDKSADRRNERIEVGSVACRLYCPNCTEVNFTSKIIYCAGEKLNGIV